jgi:uncharacterized protein YjiS (DUF1127 family)
VNIADADGSVDSSNASSFGAGGWISNPLIEQSQVMEMIMSTMLRAPAGAQGAATPPWTWTLDTLKRWWVAYITWRIERAMVARLWSMSDRELKDIGLTRSGIPGVMREATRDRLCRGHRATDTPS